MAAFLAIIAFGFALYLFFITNNKIKNLKSSLLIEEARKELESLITEFNAAAARNIEILEDRITTLQELIKKADSKIILLEEKAKSSIKPIIIEKVVEKKKDEIKTETKIEKKEETQTLQELNRVDQKKELEENLKDEDKRITRLKKLIREGKTKEELISLGFLENEINLVSFLLKKEKV
jgi:5'-3' exonuclease